eukprot:11102142-Alexandrium_andersonii.AAC.1
MTCDTPPAATPELRVSLNSRVAHDSGGAQVHIRLFECLCALPGAVALRVHAVRSGQPEAS